MSRPKQSRRFHPLRFELLEDRRLLAAGDLDPTFGNGGLVTTDFPYSHEDFGQDLMATQADGKIVVAGTTRGIQGKDFALARYLSDGSLDLDFGIDGKVTTNVGSSNEEAWGLTIGQDGKIVVVGHTYRYPSGDDFAVVRYNPDGSLDTTFDVDGIVTTDFGSPEDWALDVAFDADGKIVVGGYRNAGGTATYDFAIARYNDDGSLDATLDADGKVTLDFASSNDRISALTLQGDGKILAVGSSWSAGANADFALARFHTDGSLDSGFGSGGVVTTHFGYSQDFASSVALQADGKIVAAGSVYGGSATGTDFGLARYDADGNLDASFGNGGLVITNFCTESQNLDLAYGVAILGDGKIVAGGTSCFATGKQDLALARYDSDGALDTDFGDDGLVTTDYAATQDMGYALVVQADGKLLLGGYVEYGGPRLSDFLLVRHDPDGTLDIDFGQNGKVTTDFFSLGSYDAGYSIALQPDGKIVVAGSTRGRLAYDNDFAVTRYHSDGSLDTSFGDGGRVVTDFGFDDDEAWGVAVQSDGKIVVAGYTLQEETGWDFALVRYLSDGSLDADFGTGGRVITDFGFANDLAYGFRLQSDGKIILAGSTNTGPGSSDFALARYNTDGSLDPTFGGDGRVTTDIGIGYEEFWGVVSDSDGKIVAAGYSAQGRAGYDFALVRYNVDGSRDASFGEDGFASVDFSSGSDFAYSVTLQSDGKLVVGGESYQGGSGADFALARLDTDGTLDSSFGTGGTVVNDCDCTSDTGFAVTLDAEERILLAGYTYRRTGFSTRDYDFSLLRYDSDGQLDPTFGSGGRVLTDFGSGSDLAYDVVVQPDGKIVLAGESFQGYENYYDLALARYEGGGATASNPFPAPPGDADLDSDFGTAGSVTTGFLGSNSDYGQDIVVQQADGKIIAVGYSQDVLGQYDFAVSRYHADGSLDPSFGVAGRVTTDLGASWEYARSVALQADGKLVVAGSAYSSYPAGNDFALARYNTDGSLDTSFGSEGLVITDFNASSDEAYSVAIQSDGKLVVAGSSYQGSTTGTDFAIARYYSDGTLDTSFGGDGRVVLDFGSWYDGATSVVIQPDGMIVAAGSAYLSNPSGYRFALVRYRADGSLDTTFDSDGRVTTPFGSASAEAQSLALQSDGKLVVAGYSHGSPTGYDFTLARYHTNGSLDASFDGDGWTTTDFNSSFDRAYDVVVQADHKLVAAGRAGNEFGLARYHPDGSLDTTFDSGGLVTIDFGGNFSQATGVVLQTGGKIVALGHSIQDGTDDSDFALARFEDDGSLDTTFDDDGLATTNFLGATHDQAASMALQADGKIVVAGTSQSSRFTTVFAVVRYHADGSLDTSFGSGGRVSTSFGSGTAAARGVAIQADGKIVVAGNSDGDFVVARYNSDGSLDTSFDDDGRVTTDFGSSSDSAASVALQSDGKIVVAGSSEADFALARYNLDGSLDVTFDGDGLVTTDLGSGDYAYGLVIQTDDKLVAAGSSARDFAVVRYNSDGSLDNSFGMQGVVTTDIDSSSDQAYGVALQADGKIVAAGYTYQYIFPNQTYRFAVTRYDTNGNLDTSFGGNGIVTTQFSGVDFASSIAVQADGKLVVAGRSLLSGAVDIAVARYNADGSLDADFGGDGKVETDLATCSSDVEASVVIQPDGKILVAGSSRSALHDTGLDFALVRYEGVVTPHTGIEWLIDQVYQLVDEGTLNNGQGNSLLTKLEGSIYQLDQDRLAVAINKLEAFVNEINALVRGGTLSDEEGQPLIDEAESVLAQLLDELLTT